MKSQILGSHILLGLILAGAFAVRLWRISFPLADWHSWRQVDTAGVTREYLKRGIDLLHPRYMDISSIPSGQENPQGWRMVEFPLINGLTAFLYQSIPLANTLELHVFSRLISILFSLSSLVMLYLLVLILSGQRVALMATIIFGLLPYNIYFSRVVLPEVPLVFFTLATLYFLVRYFLAEKHSLGSISFWLAAISAAISVLLKPIALFLSLPILYFGWKRCRFKLLKTGKSYLWLALVLTPLVLWRIWISQYPEGIPAFTWLLNGNGIRFKGAFFRWLFADRLGRLILGYWGLIPFGIGLLINPNQREGWFYRWWLIGILAYFVVFATGNVQHDYYQIISIPIICVFVAKGLNVLLHPPKEFSKNFSYLLAAVCLLFTIAFGWFHIRDYFNINHPEIVEAGATADRILPTKAVVIAPYGGDTAFLYQTNRNGWPISGSVADKVSKGATHYVSVSFDDETDELMEKCQTILKTDRYVIINLGKCVD